MDRNFVSAFDVLALSASLSARRAWIEIVDPDKDTLTDDVALRKESVDRNMLFLSFPVGVGCRSPQGERG